MPADSPPMCSPLASPWGLLCPAWSAVMDAADEDPLFGDLSLAFADGLEGLFQTVEQARRRAGTPQGGHPPVASCTHPRRRRLAALPLPLAGGRCPIDPQPPPSTPSDSRATWPGLPILQSRPTRDAAMAQLQVGAAPGGSADRPQLPACVLKGQLGAADQDAESGTAVGSRRQGGKRLGRGLNRSGSGTRAGVATMEQRRPSRGAGQTQQVQQQQQQQEEDELPAHRGQGQRARSRQPRVANPSTAAPSQAAADSSGAGGDSSPGQLRRLAGQFELPAIPASDVAANRATCRL